MCKYPKVPAHPKSVIHAIQHPAATASPTSKKRSLSPLNPSTPKRQYDHAATQASLRRAAYSISDFLSWGFKDVPLLTYSHCVLSQFTKVNLRPTIAKWSKPSVHVVLPDFDGLLHNAHCRFVAPCYQLWDSLDFLPQNDTRPFNTFNTLTNTVRLDLACHNTKLDSQTNCASCDANIWSFTDPNHLLIHFGFPKSALHPSKCSPRQQASQHHHLFNSHLNVSILMRIASIPLLNVTLTLFG